MVVRGMGKWWTSQKVWAHEHVLLLNSTMFVCLFFLLFLDLSLILMDPFIALFFFSLDCVVMLDNLLNLFSCTYRIWDTCLHHREENIWNLLKLEWIKNGHSLMSFYIQFRNGRVEIACLSVSFLFPCAVSVLTRTHAACPGRVKALAEVS